MGLQPPAQHRLLPTSPPPIQPPLMGLRCLFCHQTIASSQPLETIGGRGTPKLGCSGPAVCRVRRAAGWGHGPGWAAPARGPMSGEGHAVLRAEGERGDHGPLGPPRGPVPTAPRTPGGPALGVSGPRAPPRAAPARGQHRLSPRLLQSGLSSLASHLPFRATDIGARARPEDDT